MFLPPSACRFAPLDTVLDNVKLLVTLSGREEIAKHVEGLVKAKIGNKGLEGIDPARPFGVYGRFGKDLNEISGVLLVPMVDEATFLALLENLNVKPTKNEKTGIYTVQGRPAACRDLLQVRSQVCLLHRPQSRSSRRQESAAPRAQSSPPTRRLRSPRCCTVDQLPDAIKNLVKTQVEEKVQDDLSRKVPGETPAQRAFRKQLGQELVEDVATIIRDGQEFGHPVQVDKTSKEMAVTLTLSAQEQTPLAKHLRRDRPSQESLRRHEGQVGCVPELGDGRSTQDAAEELRRRRRGSSHQDPQGRPRPGQEEAGRGTAQRAGPNLQGGRTRRGGFLPGARQGQALHDHHRCQGAQGDRLNQNFRDLLEELIKQIPDSERERSSWMPRLSPGPRSTASTSAATTTPAFATSSAKAQLFRGHSQRCRLLRRRPGCMPRSRPPWPARPNRAPAP